MNTDSSICIESIEIAALNFVEILQKVLPKSVERGAAIIKINEAVDISKKALSSMSHV